MLVHVAFTVVVCVYCLRVFGCGYILDVYYWLCGFMCLDCVLVIVRDGLVTVFGWGCV